MNTILIIITFFFQSLTPIEYLTIDDCKCNDDGICKVLINSNQQLLCNDGIYPLILKSLGDNSYGTKEEGFKKVFSFKKNEIFYAFSLSGNIDRSGLLTFSTKPIVYP